MNPLTLSEARQLKPGDVLIGIDCELPLDLINKKVIIETVEEVFNVKDLIRYYIKDSNGERRGPWNYYRFAKASSYIKKQWRNK